MKIKWELHSCGIKQSHSTQPSYDGILSNGLVAFALFPPKVHKYWELKMLTFGRRSLYFESEESAKKEAQEIANGRSRIKIY